MNMMVSAKGEAKINSTAYYWAARMANDLCHDLATKGRLSDKQVEAMELGLDFSRHALSAVAGIETIDSGYLKTALEHISPKLRIAASAVLGRKALDAEIIGEVTIELKGVIAKKEADPQTNRIAYVFFKELSEYYARMKLEAEARGL